MKLYCTNIVNSTSINLTPFSRIRITYTSTFAYDPNGYACAGDVYIYSAKKKQLKKVTGLYADYQVYNSTDIDVSNINEQSFVQISFRSARKVIYGGVNISKIEFLT